MSKRIWQDVDGNWANTANWSGAAVPVTGDDVYILAGVQNIVTGLAQSGVTLSSLTVGQGFAGTAGLDATPLAISWTTGYFGVPNYTGANQSGSGRIVLDAGSVQFTSYIYGTGTSATPGLEPIRIKGTHASNKLVCMGGTTGFSTNLVSDVGTVLEADVVNGAKLNFGIGVTWGTVTVADRSVFNTQSGGGTTLTVTDSSVAVVNGTALVGVVNCNGNITYNIRPGSGNVITTANLYADGTLNFSQNPATGTIGTLNHYKGGTWQNNDAVPNHITATTWNKVDSGTTELV